MAKYLCIAKITGVNDAGGSPMEFRKGQVVEATSSQITAWGASNFRLMNNPGAGSTVITYLGGATLTLGTAPASGTHDTLGEAAGAAN